MELGHIGPRTAPRRHRAQLALGATVAAALALTACGSSSGVSGNSAAAGGSVAGGGSSSACLTEANAYLKPYDTLPTSLPTSPPGHFTALAAKPKSGGTVVSLVQPIPAALTSAKAVSKAAASVGWTNKIVNFDGTVPDLISKFSQSLSPKPTAIWIDGYPPEALTSQIAAAKKAGVLVAFASTAGTPESVSGFGSITNSTSTVSKVSEISANLTARASECSAKVLAVTLPYPIIETTGKQYTKFLTSLCSACSVKTKLIQTQDIGTPNATNAIVSALQADPSIKYLFLTVGNLGDSLPSALSQAGLSGITVLGATPDDASIAALRAKTNYAWIDLNSDIQGWVAFDGIVRAIATGKVVTDDGNYPLWVLTQDNVPSGTTAPVYPTNYQDLFTKLWGVSA